jgi:hypothetical protein
VEAAHLERAPEEGGKLMSALGSGVRVAMAVRPPLR